MSTRAVGLHVIRGSQDYKYFTQIFLVKSVPSIFVIKQSKVVECFFASDDLSEDEFDKRLQSVFGLDANGEAHNSQPSAGPGQNAEPDQNVEPDQTNESHVQFISQPASSSLSPDADDSTPPTNISHDQSSPPPPASTSASEAYKERVMKQRKQESAERQRILKLVQTDREERRARQHPPHITSPPPKPRSLSNSNECALIIRLLDGTALKHFFSALDTLSVVRQWVDENRTDSDQPYSFFQSMPKRSFGAAEESSSLRELSLAPSSTLILKPSANVSYAYTAANYSPGDWIQRGAGAVVNAFSTFLGIGYQPQQPPISPSANITTGSYSILAHEPVQQPPLPSADIDSEIPDSASPGSPVPLDVHSVHPLVSARSASTSARGSASSSSTNVRTLYDERRPTDDRVTYNGNQLSLEDDK